MRQVVLDTETTGLEPLQGHRIIEIGCVELIDRRPTGNLFHQYLQPEREIDAAAVDVHGITNEFLTDKPRFADVVGDFMEYVTGAELIIHNAPFDVGFLNCELGLLKENWKEISEYCIITDTLVMAKKRHPGQRNSLDALCKRYTIENSHRELHGALLDAELLSDVYLALTGGQAALKLDDNAEGLDETGALSIKRVPADRLPLNVIRATEGELQRHQERLDAIEKEGGRCIWRSNI